MRLRSIIPAMRQGDEMYPGTALVHEGWQRYRRRHGLDVPREEWKMCAYWACQRMFPPRHKNQRYCRRRCKAAAWRARERGRLLELRDPSLPHEPEDRYRVISVTGYSTVTGGNSTRLPGTSYSVVDDAYNGREVAQFYAEDPALRGLHGSERRQRAQELCDALNADERDWELGRGQYAP